MKAKSKYLYIPIAIVVFAVIGFFVQKETREQPASDVIWALYYPILTTLGTVVAIGIFFWIIKQSTKLGTGNDSNQVIGIFGRGFSRLGRLTPIILGWLSFIASIMFLHPKIWDTWYGNGGQAPFWIAQALFVLLLLAFHKHKTYFYLLITAAVAVSFWTGFSEELKENGIVKSFDPVNTTYRLCWEDPRKKKIEPCTPKGERKYGKLFVDIKEYNSAMFFFTVFMKEGSKYKELAPFRWDKIKNPKYGTWYQVKPRREDHGKWSLKRVGNMFIGWHTGKDGYNYPMTLTPVKE